MKALQISTMTHPQSGKEVKSIVILGHEYLYSDNRGYCMCAEISKDLAKEIIASFDTKMGKGAFGNEGKPVYMPERMVNDTVILKWHAFKGEKYELAIHDIGHVWASKEIEL
jgi:hypothetical protein